MVSSFIIISTICACGRGGGYSVHLVGGAWRGIDGFNEEDIAQIKNADEVSCDPSSAF
jgi:hypothetical protein